MRTLIATLVLGLSLACGLVEADVGHAATGTRHCVVWIAPISDGGHSKVSPMRCFAHLATSQRVAQGRAPAGFSVGGQSGLVAAASTRISIDYDASGFTGSTLIWTVSNTSGCNGGFSYSAASMPSGWNDRVSSSHSYNGCANNWHYHDSTFLGASLSCTCSTMGTMTNQTSSERWTS